jgi:cytochrome bd-type quinol oxidase subunit 1
MVGLAIGTFFARFWRESGDRLFGCLAAAFWVFAVNSAMLGVLSFAERRLRVCVTAGRLRRDAYRHCLEGP